MFDVVGSESMPLLGERSGVPGGCNRGFTDLEYRDNEELFFGAPFSADEAPASESLWICAGLGESSSPLVGGDVAVPPGR